jgi:hypothetical protein
MVGRKRTAWPPTSVDVHIWTGKSFHRQEQLQVRPKQYDDDALRAILRLPLKALNVGLTRPSCQAVHECFTRISSKLECLISNVPGVVIVGNLHLLVHLTVLVVKIHRDGATVQTIGCGPATQLARGLLALHELQSLHYDDRNVDALLWAAPVQLRPDQEHTSAVKEAREVLIAVRHLSMEHKLRNLSIRWRNSMVTHQSDVLDLGPLDGALLEQVQLALEELDVSGVRMRAEDWPVLPQWQLKELRICTALELSPSQIRLLEAWSAWETIHLNPSR